MCIVIQHLAEEAKGRRALKKAGRDTQRGPVKIQRYESSIFAVFFCPASVAVRATCDFCWRLRAERPHPLEHFELYIFFEGLHQRVLHHSYGMH